MHAFWLVLTYDLLEDRRIDDVIIKTFFNSLLYKTNRFQVAVRLFSNRSQRTSKCGKNISDTLGCASCATFLFLPNFDVIFDLLLNRHTATWNLFVELIVVIVFVTVAVLMEEVVVMVVLLVVIRFARLSFWISKDRELCLYHCELSLFLVPCLIRYLPIPPNWFWEAGMFSCLVWKKALRQFKSRPKP